MVPHLLVVVDSQVQLQTVALVVMEKLVELVVIGVKMVLILMIQEMEEQQVRQSTDRQMFQLVV